MKSIANTLLAVLVALFFCACTAGSQDEIGTSRAGLEGDESGAKEAFDTFLYLLRLGQKKMEGAAAAE